MAWRDYLQSGTKSRTIAEKTLFKILCETFVADANIATKKV